MEIYGRPVVPVAGISASEHAVTLYVYEGFHDLWAVREVLKRDAEMMDFARAAALGTTHAVHGDPADPGYIWTVFARVTR